MSESLDPAPGPAEARLGQLLQTLRDDAPEPGHALAVRVVKRARVQAGLRAALSVVTHFAAAVGGFGRSLLGRRS